MSAPDRYGPSVSLWRAVGVAARDELHAWLPEYLAAHERQVGITPGTTPAPRSYMVRHAGIWRPEEQTPAVVVWVAGVTDHTADPEGWVTGTVQFAVMVVVGARDAESTGETLHRYGAAIRALFWDRPTLGGNAAGLDLVDEAYDGANNQTRDRTLAAAEYSYDAIGVLLGRRGAGPPPNADPRPDPTPPWQPPPNVQTADVDIQPTPIDPDLLVRRSRT